MEFIILTPLGRRNLKSGGTSSQRVVAASLSRWKGSWGSVSLFRPTGKASCLRGLSRQAILWLLMTFAEVNWFWHTDRGNAGRSTDMSRYRGDKRQHQETRCSPAPNSEDYQRQRTLPDVVGQCGGLGRRRDGFKRHHKDKFASVRPACLNRNRRGIKRRVDTIGSQQYCFTRRCGRHDQ